MTDNTPDFDSMSPEELMKWMESLAVRQGADEGLTTSADMEIAEVDPNSVVDEPGYIPYGMDEEEWAKRKAEEERIKAEKRAARAQQQSAPPSVAAPTPQPPAQVPPPAPAPEPAPAAPAASGGQPDFDSMSPEELMKWMESLAVRQGADEGLTTSADMEIAEVDPNSVVDEPGYIPYGMDTDEWERRKAEEERIKAEKRAARAQQAPPPAPAPAPKPTPIPPTPASTPEPEGLDLDALFAGNNELPAEQPAAAQPAPESLDLDALFSGAGTELPASDANAQDSMAWLESLSADQGDDGGLGIDLAGLGEAVTPDEPLEEDPMAWLEGLASAQANQGLSGLENLASDISEPPKPRQPDQPGAVSAPSGDNTQEWLESLAKAQGGAKDDEFITSANMPVPGGGDASEDTGPGYTDFSIESPPEEESYNALEMDLSGLADDIDVPSEITDMEDPNEWLTALVTDDGAGDEDSEELDIDLTALTQQPSASAQAEPNPDDIMGRLNQGGQDVSRDEMENFLSSMLEKGAQRTDVTDYIDEDEDDEISAELEQAELPDWLVEQVGTPPPSNEPLLPSTQPLVDNIVAPEVPEAEMPDWLQDDVVAGDETIDLEDIFADTEDTDGLSLEEIAPASRDTGELRIDDSDPWVEAFEEERQQGEEIPAWYLEKLGHTADEGVGAAIETTEEEVAIDLAESPLPDETELAEAQLAAMPIWMNFEPPYYGELQAVDTSSVAEEPVVAFVMQEDDSAESAEMPDWLLPNMEDGDEEDVEIPDWLAAAGVEDDTEIPEWLRDTFGTGEAAAVVEDTPPAPAPAPTPAPVPTPAPTPAPAPKREAPQIVQPAANVTAAISSAREKVKSGSVDDGLKEYESVIRANSDLEVVVSDLETMVKDNAHKSNPAIYRVLGDGLMRQGKLQSALDTYRKALNLL